MSAWYDVKTKQEVINIKVFEKLEVSAERSTLPMFFWLCFNGAKLFRFRYILFDLGVLFQKSVGTWGLTGLDRLLCFMIVQELQNFIVGLQRLVLKEKIWMDLLAGLNRTLAPTEGIVGLYTLWQKHCKEEKATERSQML